MVYTLEAADDIWVVLQYAALGCWLFNLAFLLQAAKVSRTNKLVRGIALVCAPFMQGMRSILPLKTIGRFTGIDVSALIVSMALCSLPWIYYGVNYAAISGVQGVYTGFSVGALQSLIWLADLAIICIFIAVVASWLPELQRNPIIQCSMAIFQWMSSPFRRMLPASPSFPIDFSPIFLLFGFQFVTAVLRSLHHSAILSLGI